MIEEILKKGLQFLCHSDFEWKISVDAVYNLTALYVLNCLLGVFQILFLRKTGRPVRKDLCRDTIIFDIIILVEAFILVFLFQKPLAQKFDELSGTIQGNTAYYQFYAELPISKPYFSGMLIITCAFRFYFALKATRVFGRFTKLIKMNAVSLIPLLIIMIVILLVTGSSLYILLSESPDSCSSIYSCIQVLIEASVGSVRYNHLGGSWSGFIFLLTTSYVLAGVLMNMVIAKINSSYKEVSRKGTLHYYRELFDLRHLYKLDPKYGYLVAMEHPFSLILLPSLLVLKYLERKTKQEEAERLRQALFKPNQFLNQERKIEKALREGERFGTWKCCLCFKCSKLNPRRGVQLEDFNHAMLRAIYAFNLFFFSLLFFLVNLPLIPVAYFVLLYLKCKAIKQNLSDGNVNQNLNLKRAQFRKLQCRQLMELLLFLIFGILQLTLATFKDTFAFAQHCWNQERKSKYSSLIQRKQEFLLTEKLLDLSRVCEAFHEENQDNSLECQVHRNVQRKLNVRIRPINSPNSASVRSLVGYLKQVCFLHPARRFIKDLRKRNSKLTLRVLREFLHYCVLLRRATLPYEVPLQVFPKLLRSTIITQQAVDIITILKSHRFPLLQLKHQTKTLPLSLRFEELNNEGISLQEQERYEAEEESGDLISSFIRLHSSRHNQQNVSNLFCSSIQKTVDGVCRLNEREDEMETLLQIRFTLQDLSNEVLTFLPKG